MACVLSKGRKLPCKSAFGGIKAVYFADFGEITAITITENTGEIALTASGIEWYKYDVKGNSSLETTVTSSRENGTTFYTQTVNLTLTFLDALTQAQLQKVAVARPYVAVEDYYGNTFLCGYENGMEFTGGTVVTGAAAGDLSGFTLTMEGMEDRAPYFITAGIATADQGAQIDPTLAAPPYPE